MITQPSDDVMHSNGSFGHDCQAALSSVASANGVCRQQGASSGDKPCDEQCSSALLFAAAGHCFAATSKTFAVSRATAPATMQLVCGLYLPLSQSIAAKCSRRVQGAGSVLVLLRLGYGLLLDVPAVYSLVYANNV